MAEQFRVLTVCTGNIHRSPLAAELLRQWIQWYADQRVSDLISVQSAGMAAVVGAPMGDFTQRIAAAFGADGSHHRAQALTNPMAHEADLILTATQRQRDEIVARVPSALRRAFTIREAAGAAQEADLPHPPLTIDALNQHVRELASHRSHGDNNIVDPEGESEDVFLQMTAEEVPALAHIARSMFAMPAAEESAYIQAAQDPNTLRSLIELTAGAHQGRR